MLKIVQENRVDEGLGIRRFLVVDIENGQVVRAAHIMKRDAMGKAPVQTFERDLKNQAYVAAGDIESLNRDGYQIIR